MPVNPSSIPLSAKDLHRLKEIDREMGTWDHTMVYGLDYKTARGQAGASEDSTGEAYSVFSHAGKYGVAPTKWLTKSWFRKMNRKVFRIPNPACGGTKPVELITDRAKRYRANHPDCKPEGPRRCLLCGSRKNVDVHHLDGNEDHGAPENLIYACRVCNSSIGAAYAKRGLGKRTRQYNAKGKGSGRRVPSFAEYVAAVAAHRRGAWDAGGRVIHATPVDVRRQYAERIWELRRQRGTASQVPF